MKELERVRWRIRRGLLELDIILERFVEAHYERLTQEEKRVFEVLLDMPDTILWDMITGRQEVEQSEQQALLKKIQVA